MVIGIWTTFCPFGRLKMFSEDLGFFRDSCNSFTEFRKSAFTFNGAEYFVTAFLCVQKQNMNKERERGRGSGEYGTFFSVLNNSRLLGSYEDTNMALRVLCDPLSPPTHGTLMSYVHK